MISMQAQGSLFNSDTSGINVTYMWFGQVVDESTWVENHARKDGKHSLRSRDDFQGYGYRYKVRIFGRDLEDKKKGTPDEELYMAEVSLPTTAGSGHGGSVQTPNLRQGNYVFGFYKDGIEATEPIIFGVLPNHAQTRLFGGDPDKGFFPRTGHGGRYGADDVANKNILEEGPDAGNPANESAEGNYVLDVRDKDILLEQRTHFLPKTYACDAKEGGILKAIQKVIKDAQALIAKIKSIVDTFAGAVSDVTNGINSLIYDVALLVTDLMKGLIDKMRGFAENFLNKALIVVQAILPPNGTPLANEAAQIAVDILACIFNKIIKGLFQAVFSALSKLLGKALDTSQCLIENFMGSILGGILGPIANALSSIGDVLGSVLSGISGILGGIFSALSAILGIIAFLTCDEEADCSAGDGWSFWYGDSSSPVEIPDLDNIIKLNAFSGGTTTGVAACSTGPIFAKPPKVTFKGGGGTGATANAIVSPSGQIVAIDIIDGGTGYTSTPTVTLDDSGPGSGSVLYARLDNDRTFYGGTNGSTSRNPNESNEPSPVVKGVPLKINSRIDAPTFTVNPISPPKGATPLGKGENLTYSDTQVNVGGNGGTQITLNGTGGNPLNYGGNPITLGDGPLFVGGNGTPVITNSGPLVVGGNGGTPVKVGGNGGSELRSDGLPIIATIDIPLFDGVEKIQILKGPYKGVFEGRGRYRNGSFSGNGILVGKDDQGKDFSLEGRFSGFNTLLTGFGEGSFKGNGIVRNSRFIGDGVFTADAKNKSEIFKNTSNQNDNRGRNVTTIRPRRPNGAGAGAGAGLSSGSTIVVANQDGTGSVTNPNGTTTAVAFVKVGATSGSPVTVNNIPVTLNGNLVTVGGNGGTLLRVDLKPGDNIAVAGGIPVTVSKLPVSDSPNGIPLVVGADSNNSLALSGGLPLSSNSGLIRTPIDLGSDSGGVSAKGSFAGPDGSSVQEVIVIDPGTGYLPAPDGTIYADGVEFSKPDSTIIFDQDSGYTAYPPNSTIPVLKGNVAYMPPGTIAAVYDNDGNELQLLTGIGQETPIPIENTGTLTTPTYSRDEVDFITDPVSSDGSYPAVLTINDILIGNPGINYSDGDQIIINPSNGAVLEPTYDKFGRVSSVNISNPGIGFTDVPNIFIRSNTGLNAVIIPIFGVKRIGNDLNELQEEKLPDMFNVVEVIDCVGKIARKK